MSFTIQIEPEAFQDIQEGIKWYNQQQFGLGKKFHSEVKAYFNSLKTNPFFQVRYKNVRCIPLKIFPFMIHFTVDKSEKQVINRAIYNTYDKPGKWEKR